MEHENLKSFTRMLNPPVSTVIVFSIAILFGVFFILWGFGVTPIAQFFNQLDIWQHYPPTWFQVPYVDNTNNLLIPAGILFFIVFFVTKISPDQQTWSRVVIVSLLISLALYYGLWRSLSSLNFDHPLNGFFSLILWFAELYFIFRNSFQAFLLLKVRDRHAEIEKNAITVMSGEFTPSVDILIPTYNESSQIIQRTVMGCQALHYPNKRIYVLDDTRREEIKTLAEKLCCEYITRPDNRYAKAGNLNNAIAKTSGDLIVIFDVDFIPTTNFLTRTVGFFQNKKVGFLQTSQEFYNADLIASNLGLADILPHATENYYSHYQLLRDCVDCTGCSGSSMVLSREAIAKVGGFVTASLSEDYFTGIRISAQGYQSVYVNEKLSAGLGVESIRDSLFQRLRWSRGTLQGFFIKENPCTIFGLKLIQRITHLEEGLLTWIGDFPRLFLLLVPFLYTLGITPIQASYSEIIYFLFPYYLAHFTSYTWLNGRTQSFLIGDIHTSIHCVPLAINFLKVMLNPFSEEFKVTPKEISREASIFNWDLAFPLIGLLAINLISFGYNIFTLLENLSQFTALVAIATIWSFYNILLITCLLITLLDAPKTNKQWFPIQKAVTMQTLDQQSPSVLTGIVTEISEFGLKIELNQKISNTTILSNNISVFVEFIEDQINFLGKIEVIESADQFIAIITFDSLNLDQHRYLVKTLFCTPGQWQRRKTLGDLKVLILLLKNAAIRCRQYFMRQVLVNVIQQNKF